MTSISAITLNALNNDQARMERVAANLANVQTPGYKREVWAERSGAPSAFAQAMNAAGEEGAQVTQSDPGAATTAHLARDMRPATLRSTGRPLDIALAGTGFFEVATEHGPAYTRRGDFHIDARGRIVNAQGQALLGQGGEITVPSERVTVDAAGRVFDGDKPVAQLRVVDAAPSDLRALGGGLYGADGAVRELPQGQVSVRQGFLENANVDTAHEMVSMTTTIRHFEALLRVTQGRDEMLGTAIRKLGDF